MAVQSHGEGDRIVVPKLPLWRDDSMMDASRGAAFVRAPRSMNLCDSDLSRLANPSIISTHVFGAHRDTCVALAHLQCPVT